MQKFKRETTVYKEQRVYTRLKEKSQQSLQSYAQKKTCRRGKIRCEVKLIMDPKAGLRHTTVQIQFY